MNSQRYPQPSRKLVITTFSGLMAWCAIVVTGMRLPYLYTSSVDAVRWYLIFPLLVGGLAYLCFIRRTPSGLTGYQQYMRSVATGRARLKAKFLGALGLILLPWGVAWSSAAFPAWMTTLFAGDHFARVYSISDLNVRGGASWSTVFELVLVDSAGEKSTLKLTRSTYEDHRWKQGETICVVGRSWLLGSVASATSRSESGCH